MINNWTRSRKFLIPSLALFILVGLGCSPEVYLAKRALRKDPLHKANIPEKPACPIDGLWMDAYASKKVGIEKGRLYMADKIMASGHDLGWPMVTTRDIVRVGPGRYRGNTITSGNKFQPCTFSVVSEDTLIEKYLGKVVTGIYKKIRLDNEKWFLEDYELVMKQASAPKATDPQLMGVTVAPENKPAEGAIPTHPGPEEHSYIQLHKVSAHPPTVMPGEKIALLIEFSASDPLIKNPVIPVRCSYTISQGQSVLFRSRPSMIDAKNGRMTEWTIHIASSKKRGDYRIDLSLAYKGDIKGQSSTNFRIDDRPSHPGKQVASVPAPQANNPYTFVLPDPGTLARFKINYGSTYMFQVTGRSSGIVYGSGFYTDDSQLAVAAVHCGVLAPGQTGIVKVTIHPGRSGYAGSSRNGIITKSWGKWDSCYTIEPAEDP